MRGRRARAILSIPVALMLPVGVTGCAPEPQLAALVEEPVLRVELRTGHRVRTFNRTAVKRSLLAPEGRPAEVAQLFRPVPGQGIDDVFEELKEAVRAQGWDVQEGVGVFSPWASAHRPGPGPPGPEYLKLTLTIDDMLQQVPSVWLTLSALSSPPRSP